ncbi:MAG: hypothetical protein ACOCZ5_01650 [bacterium]
MVVALFLFTIKFTQLMGTTAKSIVLKESKDIPLPDRIINEMNKLPSKDNPHEFDGLYLPKNKVLIRIISEISLLELKHKLETIKDSGFSRIQLVAHNTEFFNANPGDYLKIAFDNFNEQNSKYIAYNDNYINTINHVETIMRELDRNDLDKFISDNNQRWVICRYYIIDPFPIKGVIRRDSISKWFDFVKDGEIPKESISE